MLSWQTKTIALELIHAAEQDVAERRDGFICALERHLTFLSDHLHRSVTPREAQAILNQHDAKSQPFSRPWWNPIGFSTNYYKCDQF